MENFDRYLDSRVPILLSAQGVLEAFIFVDLFQPKLAYGWRSVLAWNETDLDADQHIDYIDDDDWINNRFLSLGFGCRPSGHPSDDHQELQLPPPPTVPARARVQGALSDEAVVASGQPVHESCPVDNRQEEFVGPTEPDQRSA
jgi:hypothetical protein